VWAKIGGVTIAYTDGACVGNPGPGGWAWAVPDGPYASGAAAHTTNQRMEIQAALEAALAIDGPLTIVSDSTYVVNCFRDKWWEGWLRRGWVNTAKKPVANRDLWEPLIAAVVTRGDIDFRWVKGHAGDPMNDLVDRLAVAAARTQEPARGEGTPADLGPADVPRGTAASGDGRGSADPRVPPGHLLVVAGLRPPDLGGYDDNPVATSVRARLEEILRAKLTMHPDLQVLSGMGLGAEQLGAEAALAVGAGLVAVLPFPDPDAKWPATSRQRYRDLVDRAQAQVLLQTKAPDSPRAVAAALATRDAWLGRNGQEAVVVWDRKEPFVGRAVRSFEDHFGEDVWVVDPAET
jgi:ribonuclease HI/uncharacterized phage-like protein YoqJ